MARRLVAEVFAVGLVLLACVAAAPAPARADEIVAVLNFAQRDDDARYAWLSKGLADLLINQLADLPGITVVSRDRMQSVAAEYQRIAAVQKIDERKDARPVAVVLKAGRMVFGTYAVEGGRVTLTAQVLRISDESAQVTVEAAGAYGDVLDLERELARKLRAFFLGRPVAAVPLTDVPQWTTRVGAAEHLYAGVDLFDRGEFAEAWLRFRRAAQVDPAFADAVYWQGRMLYYLMLYGNARPLLDRFFMSWPLHPRAGDAAIELLDSWRHSETDPQALCEIYARLRAKVDRRTLVHNKSTPGRETETLLATYIGGFQVQALRALGRFDEAADLALELQQESAQAFLASGVDRQHWGFYDELARFTAMERRTQLGKIVLNKEMFERWWPGYDVAELKPSFTYSQFSGGVHAKPFMIRAGRKYRADGVMLRCDWLIAPEGYVFRDIKAHATFHREPGTTPFLLFLHWGQWQARSKTICVGSSAAGQVDVDVPVPDNCRVFAHAVGLSPDRFGGTAGTDYLIDEPYRDYLEKFRLTYRLVPAAAHTGRIHVQLDNVEKARVLLDGQPALLSEGVIRGVAPGPHKVRAWATKGESSDRSTVFDPVEQTVTVAPGQTAECHLSFPFRPLRRMAGWRSPTVIGRDYPLAVLPPRTGEEELTRPCLLRVTRGPLAGRLVALWSYREELWTAYAADDAGTSWTPPRRLSIPVNSAHIEMAPQLVQDEQGRFVLAFISDRSIDRAFYPYVSTSEDLQRWTAPRKIADAVCDSLTMIQDHAGRFVLLVPPPFRSGDWGVKLRALANDIYEEVKVDVVSVYGKKYARTRAQMFTSDDLRHWTEVPTHLGGDKIREADLLQTGDGTYHAVYTTIEKARVHGESMWRVNHATSRDLVTWSEPRELLSAPWDYRNPVITTDGRRVFGSISVSGNNVHRFNLDHPDEVSWWGMASTRNILYHDPPSYGNRLHWLWLCFESNPPNYQPAGGRVLYTARPSDRGEWLLEMPKTLPPDTPEEAREKQHVVELADTRAIPPGHPWGNVREFRSDKFGYVVQIPADWVRLVGPEGRREGFFAPKRYGVLQPYFDVFVWDAGEVNDVEALGRMAARRWAGWQGLHWTLRFKDHPCGRPAYLLTYEAPWSLDQLIVTKTWGVVRDGKEYRLNARCPVEAVDEWMPVLNRMLESFRFARPSAPAAPGRPDEPGAQPDDQGD